MLIKKRSYLIGLFIVSLCKAQSSFNVNDTKLEQKANEILAKMTLEEKVSQMSYTSPAISRLNIPEMNWWNECLHGVARAGKATVFPQAIGLSAMWDRNQMFKISTAISDEARAKHHDFAKRGKRGIYQGLTYWTPNINIFRDPRWGRGMETYGEDPYLTSELAIPFIKGLQGDDPNYLKLVATAKHFVVHSGPESERHSFNAIPSNFDYLNTYTSQFESVIKKSGVYSVMCAYNRFKGLPCCGNKDLSDLLRDKWNFKGYIVSDCWAIKDFFDKGAHEVVATREEASAMAVKAGTDLNCGDSYPALVKAVKDGIISEKELDVSLRRLLVARMKLGLFAPKNAVKYEKIPISVVDSEVHRLLALETTKKSIVLLKNENNVLPLKKSLKSIAVIGPNANDLEALLGNYNGFPSSYSTPYTGIKDKLPKAKVTFAHGCTLAEGLPIFEPISPNVLFQDNSLKSNGLNAEYFSNSNFEGSPKYKRVDKTVDFTWKTTPPFKDFNYDKFSVRWTGYISVKNTGKYALGGEAFSGMKLFLDDKLLMEREDVHEPKKIYEYVTLEAGKSYKIKLEYKQNNTEYAMMRFLWEAPHDPLALQNEAIEIAKKADVIVFCMGLNPLLEGEEMKVKVDGFAGGDRVTIDLPKSQTNLMKKLKELNKPMVLVLLNGSALAINWENENIPAIVEAWYPGQAGGKAIADVLFGDYNPSGRLPLTFYKSVDDIPAFNDYNMKGKTYKYFKGKPLYEFGYGLSYTNFEYSNLQIPENIDVTKDIFVNVNIKNTGKRDGEEICQVYYKSISNNDYQTNCTLVGFERVKLKKGESKIVKIKVSPSQLFQVTGSDKMILPGNYEIFVGGMQPNDTRVQEKKVLSKRITLTGNSIKL